MSQSDRYLDGTPVPPHMQGLTFEPWPLLRYFELPPERRKKQGEKQMRQWRNLAMKTAGEK